MSSASVYIYIFISIIVLIILLQIFTLARYPPISLITGLTMAIHGRVSEFDQRKEEWTSYAERMTHYFAANKVDDGARKRSILLSAVGPATYKLLRMWQR